MYACRYLNSSVHMHIYIEYQLKVLGLQQNFLFLILKVLFLIK